jgi:hypothetical protein
VIFFTIKKYLRLLGAVGFLFSVFLASFGCFHLAWALETTALASLAVEIMFYRHPVPVLRRGDDGGLVVEKELDL